jgi:hypothetical protein
MCFAFLPWQKIMNRNCFIAVLVLISLLMGCSRNNPLGREAVRGKVTLNGVVLDQGTIQFNPKGAGGVSSGAVIKDGEYAIIAERGLPPGKYSVCINSTIANPKDKNRNRKAGPPGGGVGLPGIERISAAYNSASTLTVDVVAGQSNGFHFDTKSK